MVLMTFEHRIVSVSQLSVEKRESLLESLRAEGWLPVFHHEGAAPWSRAFPSGFVILEREAPVEKEPRDTWAW